MNTQQLQCFLCVADKLNFTRAAEELYLTTPTVTHHIQSLEHELNTKLFFRTKKSVRLTEAGRLFYQDAKDIVDQVALAKRHLEDAEHRRSKILKIGCSSRGELLRLSRVLSKFRVEFPDVHPNIIITDYFQMAGMLNEKQLDLVLATREMMKGFSGYTFRPVKRMETFVLVSTAADISEQEQISLHELDAYDLISLHPKLVPFQYGSNIQEQLQRHAQTHTDMLPESSQVCVALAAAGYGAAVLPDFLIPENWRELSLAKLRLTDGDCFEYGIAHQSKDKNKIVKRLSEIFQEM